MMRAALVILRKDLRIEWRTRETLATIAMLGVVLVIVLAVAHDPAPAAAPLLAPGVMWAAFVFTGLLGVQRSLLLEREQDCLATLVAAPIDPAAIYVAKLLGNVILLGVLQAIVVPLCALMLHVDLAPVLPALALVLLLGTLGFAAVATLYAAMTARLRTRELLLPILVLPVVVPLVIGAVKATEGVLVGGLPAAAEALGVVVAFDVMFVTAGWLLFPATVAD
jgi:heme exporter protein B